MPNKKQSDIDFAYGICEYLNIEFIEVNIFNIYNEFEKSPYRVKSVLYEEVSNRIYLNLPPRIRMILLYALAQSIPNARVINTSNLSERWIGYTIINGDNTGAFAPLAEFTSEEVIQIGRYLDISDRFTFKLASDGLTGKTDEEVIGLSYKVLNKYIRTGVIEYKEIKNTIDQLHNYNKFKFETIPTFNNGLPKLAK